MINRRAVLCAAAALPAAALPAAAQAPSGQAPRPPLSSPLKGLFQSLFQESLTAHPEGATLLGLDRGADAPLKSRLTDESEAGRAARKALTRSQLARLEAVDRAGLDSPDRLNLDTVLYTRRSAAEVENYSFGGASYGPSPYVVSQLTGAYQSTPEFLDTKHRIETDGDADAYLQRLTAFAGQLVANTEQMAADAAQGVAPPDFILDLTLNQMTRSDAPAETARVVTSLKRRAAQAGLSARYGEEAARIYRDAVRPALLRQIERTRALRTGAGHDAGTWRLKDGAAFYETALHTTTTTKLSPDEVHRIGLEQAAQIKARLDDLLKQQGMTQGSVGERMAALYKDPRQLYANTDAGKADAIAYCNQRLAEIRPRLPTLFHRVPSYRFEVRRVPPETEAGAASAFSQGPALDGSRPGLVYFNLHDAAEWPKFCLSTTVFHEGLPGHQLEGGLALSNANLPLIRKASGFSGYAEGWALYAEQLADEIGMYEDDPLGRLGYLKFQLFRANRCVVDTGLHHLRWSREKAVNYFVEQEGEAPGFAAREVERYCSTPGQACSYKLGHTVFVTLRERAKAKMKDRFDIKNFHDAVLNCGRVPLDILQSVGEDWIASNA